MLGKFEWVGLPLPHDCRLAPNFTLYSHTFYMLIKGTSC